MVVSWSFSLRESRQSKFSLNSAPNSTKFLNHEKKKWKTEIAYFHFIFLRFLGHQTKGNESNLLPEGVPWARRIHEGGLFFSESQIQRVQIGELFIKEIELISLRGAFASSTAVARAWLCNHWREGVEAAKICLAMAVWEIPGLVREGLGLQTKQGRSKFIIHVGCERTRGDLLLAIRVQWRCFDIGRWILQRRLVRRHPPGLFVNREIQGKIIPSVSMPSPNYFSTNMLVYFSFLKPIIKFLIFIIFLCIFMKLIF